jgi:hypothetical protein
MGKSVLEKQLQAYGEFQSVIRKMSKEEEMQYAPTGDLAKERDKRLNDLEKRRESFAKELKEFENSKPLFGNLGNLSEEQVLKIADITAEWSKKRKDYEAFLRKKYRL